MASEARYKLLYVDKQVSPIFHIQFEKFAVTVLGIPLFAFWFCIVYSILFNFEASTYTHCGVYNVLPSISAAIGSYSPQREVWQLAVFMQTIPRVFVAKCYLKQNLGVLCDDDQWMGYLTCLLNTVEIIALVVLSFWTSSRAYPVHSHAFVTFVIVSELYMILMFILRKRCKRVHKKSLRWKKRLLVTNISSILVGTYFFMRHNSMCEPYVYSVFAFAEYLVVLSNMAFHLTSVYDFQDQDIIFYNCGVKLTER